MGGTDERSHAHADAEYAYTVGDVVDSVHIDDKAPLLFVFEDLDLRDVDVASVDGTDVVSVEPDGTDVDNHEGHDAVAWAPEPTSVEVFEPSFDDDRRTGTDGEVLVLVVWTLEGGEDYGGRDHVTNCTSKGDSGCCRAFVNITFGRVATLSLTRVTFRFLEVAVENLCIGQRNGLTSFFCERLNLNSRWRGLLEATKT